MRSLSSPVAGYLALAVCALALTSRGAAQRTADLILDIIGTYTGSPELRRR
jgi:hypothetical protein